MTPTYASDLVPRKLIPLLLRSGGPDWDSASLDARNLIRYVFPQVFQILSCGEGTAIGADTKSLQMTQRSIGRSEPRGGAARHRVAG